jgi:hypothetical protein
LAGEDVDEDDLDTGEQLLRDIRSVIATKEELSKRPIEAISGQDLVNALLGLDECLACFRP